MPLTDLADVPCMPNCNGVCCVGRADREQACRDLAAAVAAGEWEVARDAAERAMRYSNVSQVAERSGLAIADVTRALNGDRIDAAVARLKAGIAAEDVEEAGSAAYTLVCLSIPLEDAAQQAGVDPQAVLVAYDQRYSEQ